MEGGYKRSMPTPGAMRPPPKVVHQPIPGAMRPPPIGHSQGMYWMGQMPHGRYPPIYNPYPQMMGQIGQMPPGMHPPNPAAYGYYPYPQGAPQPQGYEQYPRPAMYSQSYPQGAPPPPPPQASPAAGSLQKNALGIRNEQVPVENVGEDNIVNVNGMYLFIYVLLSELFVVQSNENIILPYFYNIENEVDRRAFYNCSNLREVIFNEGLQKIRECSFARCNNLREVVFHGVPREIAKDAFDNCTSLERITFPTISTRLDNLIQTGHWEEIENEVDEVRGVVQRSGGELILSAQTIGGGRNWNTVRRDLNNIIRLISCHELKEATSIFELALWKFKLDQVDKANPITRKKCRMDVPGPVKDIILQYLPYECLLPVLDT